MSGIRNASDLDKYLKSQSVQNKIVNSKNYQEVLKREAERLKGYVQEEIDNYYNSYTPKVYNRTYGLQRALRMDDEVKITMSGKTLQIEIYFDEDSDTGYSLFSNDTIRKSDLINYGWETHGKFKDTEHFGWQNGYNFIEKAVDRFNRENPYNIKIEIKGERPTVKR